MERLAPRATTQGRLAARRKLELVLMRAPTAMTQRQAGQVPTVAMRQLEMMPRPELAVLLMVLGLAVQVLPRGKEMARARQRARRRARARVRPRGRDRMVRMVRMVRAWMTTLVLPREVQEPVVPMLVLPREVLVKMPVLGLVALVPGKADTARPTTGDGRRHTGLKCCSHLLLTKGAM